MSHVHPFVEFAERTHESLANHIPGYGFMTGRLERRLVAVMFTDMVGYTSLMVADERQAVERRDRYIATVARHHGTFGGSIIQRLGDGTMSMFPSALDAVLAGVEIQRELNALTIPVRIGIHVGEVVVEPDRLTGEAVNIASRVESFAVPGAVMLSDVAYDQVKNHGDVRVVGLGRFRLKNVGRPFELYAVAADGVVVPDSHALTGKGDRITSIARGLPAFLGILIGRESDLDAIQGLTRQHRVVTITGPGGVGKTTVLIELGRRLSPGFPDGVAFVPMADVNEASAFMLALAAALDLKEAEERTLEEGLVSLIGDSSVVLLLDNLEQIVEAAPALARLVDRCPSLRVVATSRTRLRIGGEREYPLAPLALPPPEAAALPESLEMFSAIALFLERGRGANPDFDLTPANAAAVAAICHRLDGLPLALELAAARLRILTPEALLERLENALGLLTGGPRDVPLRQQTLRATIDWSHSLLTESEQRLFRRLSVFQGGFTFPDIEAICGADGDEVLDGTDSLLEKGLVQTEGRGTRLQILQTIGEYGRERLQAAGEAEPFALKHAYRYAAVAQEIRDGIEGVSQLPSVERGMAEEANLQTALDTLLAAARGGDAKAGEAGLGMAGDLWMFWHVRGKNLTARDYATDFLALDSAVPTVARIGALLSVGLACWMAGEFERGNRDWAEARRLAAEVSTERELCLASLCLGLGSLNGSLDAALSFAADAVDRGRAMSFDWGVGLGLTVSGMIHGLRNEPAIGRQRLDEALSIQRRLGDAEGAGMSLSALAQIAATSGNLLDSLSLYAQSLSEFESVGDRGEEARVLSEMAWTCLEHGDSSQARRYFLDAIRAHTDVGSLRGEGTALLGLAAAEGADGRSENAIRIAAAAETHAREEGIVVVYAESNPGQRYMDAARAAISAADFDAATAAGAKLSLKEAVDLARSTEPAD